MSYQRTLTDGWFQVTIPGDPKHVMDTEYGIMSRDVWLDKEAKRIKNCEKRYEKNGNVSLWKKG